MENVVEENMRKIFYTIFMLPILLFADNDNHDFNYDFDFDRVITIIRKSCELTDSKLKELTPVTIREDSYEYWAGQHDAYVFLLDCILD